MLIVYGVLLLMATVFALALTGLTAVYRRSKRLFLATIILFVVAPLVGYASVLRASKLQDVPRALGVDTILFDRGISFTWADAGIRVYALPPAAGASIAAGGERYLNSLPHNRNRWLERWRGDYSGYGGWRRTPIVPGRTWQRHAGTGRLSVQGYFAQREWRMVRRHDDVVQEIESAINQPGSFYAVGRAGTLIISPAVGKAFYLHFPCCG